MKRSSFLKRQLSFNKNTDVKGIITAKTEKLKKFTDYKFRVQKDSVKGF